MQIILTGGTGYVGRAILRQVAKRKGALQVRLMARSEAQVCSLMAWSECPTWLQVIPGRLPEVPDALFDDRPSVLVHFGVKQIDSDGSGYSDINVRGTEALLAAAPAAVAGVIYGSTLSVLGGGAQRNVGEQVPMVAESALARSRAAAEVACYTWGKQRGRAATALRPRFILGAEDQFVLPGLVKLARKGMTIGSGRQQFSIIEVNDYASIVLALASHWLQGGEEQQGAQIQHALHIGYPRPVSLNEILALAGESVPAIDRQWGVPIPWWNGPWLERLHRWVLPKTSGAVEKTLTQLALVGFDHYGDTHRLRQYLAGTEAEAVVNRSEKEALRQVMMDFTQHHNNTH